MTALPSIQQPDPHEAERFLAILDESAESFCFRVFDDNEKRKDARLAAKLDGALADVWPQLIAKQAQGCGVYVVANAGEQTSDTIYKVRAVFADTDGAPLDPIIACGLEPHVIVESSPGKWHVYWLVDGLPLDAFRDVQRAIAARFGTDKSVNDLARVMRLPGLYHQKGAPFRTRIIHESGAKPYAADRILGIFPRTTPEQPAASSAKAGSLSPGLVIDTDRHADVLKCTLLLSQSVRAGAMTRQEAFDTMRARRDAGRYSRHVPDEEIARALEGAISKAALNPVERAANDDPWWGFRFAPDMLANIGPTRWLVRGMLPEDCTGVLYGPSGSMKSFVMIDMALSIAHGVPWQEHETKRRTVIYMAGEGEQGFAKRVLAWCESHNLPPPPNFAFRQIPRLQDAVQLEKLIATVRKIIEDRGDVGLIIIDTLFTALDGGDENSGKDMGQLIAVMKRLRQEFLPAVLGVHHTGKVGETARGHSSLPSGMDVMFYAKPGMTPMTVEITNPKQKDGAEHPSILLQAEVHKLPIIGEDGEQETSLVLCDPAAAIISAHGDRHKVTEEMRVIAQSSRARRDAVEAQIKEEALRMLAGGCSSRMVEARVEQIAREAEMPYLARKRSQIQTWKREAGLK